jgi:hypothetical protein
MSNKPEQPKKPQGIVIPETGRSDAFKRAVKEPEAFEVNNTEQDEQVLRENILRYMREMFSAQLAEYECEVEFDDRLLSTYGEKALQRNKTKKGVIRHCRLKDGSSGELTIDELFTTEQLSMAEEMQSAVNAYPNDVPAGIETMYIWWKNPERIPNDFAHEDVVGGEAAFFFPGTIILLNVYYVPCLAYKNGSVEPLLKPLYSFEKCRCPEYFVVHETNTGPGW